MSGRFVSKELNAIRIADADSHTALRTVLPDGKALMTLTVSSSEQAFPALNNASGNTDINLFFSAKEKGGSSSQVIMAAAAAMLDLDSGAIVRASLTCIGCGESLAFVCDSECLFSVLVPPRSGENVKTESSGQQLPPRTY